MKQCGWGKIQITSEPTAKKFYFNGPLCPATTMLKNKNTAHLILAQQKPLSWSMTTNNTAPSSSTLLQCAVISGGQGERNNQLFESVVSYRAAGHKLSKTVGRKQVIQVLTVLVSARTSPPPLPTFISLAYSRCSKPLTCKPIFSSLDACLGFHCDTI